ncbi:MAG TPA: asparaginase [Mycobacteriales bacterium]|nr:asparaginase [Mycobacteriales bacterium]
MSLLAEVVRSGYVEGTHSGAVLAVRADGSVALSVGDVDRPWFPRSSNKPLQAAALLDAGWAPTDERQVAVAAASHSGEPGHVDVVRSVLAALDLLGCPPALPLDEAAAHALLRAGGGPSPLTMNCSGKHAAMIATCLANGWPVASYLSPDHALQQAVQRRLEDLAGEQVQHVAVDGCGAPQHALTLPGLARAYRRLATSAEPGARRVREAMRTHPWYVGGTGRDVTRLMEGVPGLVAKDGAEGVYAAALPDGSAAVVKIADGGGRARTPVLVAALRALGCDAPVLDELATTAVLGGGHQVGEVRVAGDLARLS